MRFFCVFSMPVRRFKKGTYNKVFKKRAAKKMARRKPLSFAARVKKVTTKPVLVGVGVSNAEQAVEASRVADGVIMGASVVRRMIEGGPDAVGAYVREVRQALDSTKW
jgi:tryptophan synthase alpha subunit